MPQDHHYDPKWYTSPATIPSMVRLREFFLDYFTQFILNDRDDTARVLPLSKGNSQTSESTSPDPPNFDTFIKLLTHTPDFFSRAQAVIPELSPQASLITSTFNLPLQAVLEATTLLRSQSIQDLPEDIVWEKFLEGKMLGIDKLKEGFLPSELAAMDLQHGSQQSTPRPQHKELIAKPASMKVTIPEFVPSSRSHEMVWSPTTGSRPRRPSDDFKTHGSQLTTFKETIAGTRPPSTPRLTDLRQATRTPVATLEPSSLSPHRSRSNPTFLTGLADSQPGSRFSNSPRQFADQAHYHPITHRKSESASSDPTSISPSKRSEVYLPAMSDDRQDQSRPAEIFGFDRIGLNVSRTSAINSSVDVVGHQDQDPQSNGRAGFSHKRQGPMKADQIRQLQLQQDQLPRLPGAVYSPYEGLDPSLMPPTLLTDDGSVLTVPLQGNMDPLTYWNYLFQRQSMIMSRLAAGGFAPTATQRRFIDLLQQARVHAASSQLPIRGSMGKKVWLNLLEDVLSQIWVLQPGQPEFDPLVVERKKDFRTAVLQAMEMAKAERHEKSGRGRGRGRGGPYGG
ncbi:uncharacterized protein KY384_006143 [Bacidia gigantensis]|uniref:uncharacterized protein n=1 Tax=Bacidia gigantensis TaxID=2732470 RepID=UPI001D03924E|nr:uncharacterized protein KY384_006143 [Bacidia gigantensis]KAG8529506.1 hypothetical protein KY384_006143 [Bacidia gigantensis]